MRRPTAAISAAVCVCRVLSAQIVCVRNSEIFLGGGGEVFTNCIALKVVSFFLNPPPPDLAGFFEAGS